MLVDIIMLYYENKMNWMLTSMVLVFCRQWMRRESVIYKNLISEGVVGTSMRAWIFREDCWSSLWWLPRIWDCGKISGSLVFPPAPFTVFSNISTMDLKHLWLYVTASLKDSGRTSREVFIKYSFVNLKGHVRGKRCTFLHHTFLELLNHSRWDMNVWKPAPASDGCRFITKPY